MKPTTTADKVLSLAREMGFVRARDAVRRGIPTEHLRRLVRRGLLVQPARGVYRLADHEPGLHHSLASVSKKIPNGIVCLLSALQFHEITTQLPHEVWIAVDGKAWRPATAGLPVRIVRFSGAAFAEGVEEHTIEGVPVRITCPAKTVADCFKYRSKVGLDVALEALRDCHRRRRCSMDDLWKYAKVCRVANVMRPYMEMESAG